MNRLPRLAVIGAALCVAAVAIWLLHLDSPSELLALACGLAGTTLVLLFSPVPKLPRVSPTARVGTLSVIAFGLAIYAYASSRAPRVRLRIETYSGTNRNSPATRGNSRVVYVVPLREWQDSLAGPCAEGARRRDSLINAEVAGLSPEHRARYNVFRTMLTDQLRDLQQPVTDTAAVSAAWRQSWHTTSTVAERYGNDSIALGKAMLYVFYVRRPWWPNFPTLFQPLFRRAASVAHAIARDSFAVSPAGYTSSIGLHPEEELVVVYGWADSLLVRAIRVPPGEGADRFVDHAHLDEQLCAAVIPR